MAQQQQVDERARREMMERANNAGEKMNMNTGISADYGCEGCGRCPCGEQQGCPSDGSEQTTTGIQL